MTEDNTSHSPKRVHVNASSLPKLQQVLDYSNSLDKVSDLLGVDIPTVHEIYKEQAEEQMQLQMLKNTPRNKRDSQKALALLGRNPSAEKVQKTLGIDEDMILQLEHDLQKQQEQNSPQGKLVRSSSLDKRHSAKALSTLGVDPSLRKATSILGMDDEERAREICLEEQLAQEEKIVHKRKAETEHALHDKKHNSKALHVVGYDPSLEKAMDTLGVAAGTQEEAQVGAILGAQVKYRAQAGSQVETLWWPSVLVYTLTFAVLVSCFVKHYR